MGLISKYKTFTLWLGTYIIVFMIPFMFIIFNYFYSISIIRTESSLHKKTSQNQLKSIIDFQISEIEKITSQLIWDRQIRLYLKTSGFDSEFRRQIESKITELRFLNNFIYQIYIVNEKEDISPGERIIPDNFQASNIDWEKIYADKDKSVYLKDIDSTNKGDELYFITKFFMIDEGNTDQYLVVFLNRDFLKDSFTQIEWIDHGSGFIIDSDGRVISSVVNVEPPEYFKTDYLSILEEYDNYQDYFEIEKNSSMASVIKSDILDWYYVIITSKSAYFGKILDFQKRVLLSLFITLISGIFLSIIFTRKNYLHIKELVKLFSGSNIQEIYQKYLDEYDILENEIKSVISENASIKKTISGSSIGIKTIFLRRLLSGEEIDQDVLNDLSNLCEINFKYSGFCAVLVKSGESSCGDFFNLESILNSKSESLEKLINAYFVSYSGNAVIILNLEFSTDPAMLDQRLIRISELITADNDCDFFICAGKVYDSLSAIPVSYSEALKVLEYKTLLGDKNIFMFSDLIDQQKSRKFKYLSFLENEYKIYNLFTAHKYGEAKTLLIKEMELVEEIYNDVEILKIRLAGFKNIIIESLNAILRQEDERLKKYVKIIMECRSFPVLRENCELIIDELSSIVPDKTASVIAGSAKNYIEKNYMKKDLTITEIAEKLGLTPQHLSKIFKQINGTGLLQYINRCRIEEAKKILLNDEEINIKEAARIAGYYNEITFIRNFKAITGISPGKYKNAADKKEKKQ